MKRKVDNYLGEFFPNLGLGGAQGFVFCKLVIDQLVNGIQHGSVGGVLLFVFFRQWGSVGDRIAVEVVDSFSILLKVVLEGDVFGGFVWIANKFNDFRLEGRKHRIIFYQSGTILPFPGSNNF